MHNSLFPIQLPTLWTPQEHIENRSEKINSWLFDKGSLTQKLEGICNQFTVKIRQQITIHSSAQGLSGYFGDTQNILLREVFLYCDDKPVVFAQTEIPYCTLTQKQAQLAEIGSQSLGKFLFHDSSMVRGDIEVSAFYDTLQFQALSDPQVHDNIRPLWARRSIFHLNNKPLLVSELFLPASGIYLP